MVIICLYLTGPRDVVVVVVFNVTPVLPPGSRHAGDKTKQKFVNTCTSIARTMPPDRGDAFRCQKEGRRNGSLLEYETRIPPT